MGDKSNEMLLSECVRRWAEDVRIEKADRMAKLRHQAEMDHLECLRSDQKAAAKRNLMRMTDDSDETLIIMCFTSWAKNKEEEKKQKDFEEREARMQKQLGEMKSKSGGSAKGVLSRVSESSTSGITGNVFVHWRDHCRTEVRARNLENTLQASEAKFKSLNQKQKGNAKHAAQNAVDLEEDNELMQIFMNWAQEVEISRVILHYSGKMKGKTEQLQQVQSMFKDFTAALEQGISNTPRTEKTEKRSSSHAKSTPKPPALPAE